MSDSPTPPPESRERQPMTAAELDAIRQRADAATAGPMVVADACDDHHDSLEYFFRVKGNTYWDSTCFERREDAEFYAAAREDIPALLSHAAYRDAEVGRLREAMQHIKRYVLAADSVSYTFVCELVDSALTAASPPAETRTEVKPTSRDYERAIEDLDEVRRGRGYLSYVRAGAVIESVLAHVAAERARADAAEQERDIYKHGFINTGILWSRAESALAAERETVRRLGVALEWYGEHAEAANRHVTNQWTTGMTAILTTLSLDAGSRARDALASPPAAPAPQSYPGDSVHLLGTCRRCGEAFLGYGFRTVCPSCSRIPETTDVSAPAPPDMTMQAIPPASPPAAEAAAAEADADNELGWTKRRAQIRRMAREYIDPTGVPDMGKPAATAKAHTAKGFDVDELMAPLAAKYDAPIRAEMQALDPPEPIQHAATAPAASCWGAHPVVPPAAPAANAGGPSLAERIASLPVPENRPLDASYGYYFGRGWLEGISAAAHLAQQHAGAATTKGRTVQLSDNGHPRRNRIDLLTPVEQTLRDAVEVVEMAGCHPLLTDAVNLLQEAREKVADFVELPAPPASPPAGGEGQK